jgi:uncharacterized glyoxalase superfamily protein PhnB
LAWRDVITTPARRRVVEPERVECLDALRAVGPAALRRRGRQVIVGTGCARNRTRDAHLVPIGCIMSSTPPHTRAGTAGAESGPLTASLLSASLTVADLQASIAWYRDVLGFTVLRTFDREGTLFAASLRAGSVPVLLTQDNGAQGADRIKGQGISLQLTTAQDIDGLAARMRARGGTLESEPADVMGARAFRLRDPDGFQLVISSPR